MPHCERNNTKDEKVYLVPNGNTLLGIRASKRENNNFKYANQKVIKVHDINLELNCISLHLWF